MSSTRYLFFWLFISSFLFISCKNELSKEERDVPEETPAVSEEELVLRLSSDLITAPRNQEEKDRNTMLNYALDSLWNVKKTPSGLYYEITAKREGERLEWGDRVEVHYEGFFMDGQKFDSSYDRKRTLEFYIGNMIDGWNEALELVASKSELRLLVPSRLAYGEKGLVTATGDTLVPPNQALAFKIKVLRKIK
ncbi:MAG: FKBP-type peptidyl-prolyl cis-trans isomerase [Bacteroidota bacterium]